jgi:hypothetical protein
VADCQWLATLHAHGLLRGGFVPPADIRQLQDYQRLRADHLIGAASQVQKMQQALERMNLKFHDDAMIFGKIVPAVGKVNVTTTIVTTDTAEIIGGGKASFTDDSTIQQLKTAPAPITNVVSVVVSNGTATVPDLSDDKPKVVKKFGNLVVELQSLKIINNSQYFLMMTLTNCSPTKSLWVAMTIGHYGFPVSSLLDQNGHQFGQGHTTRISSARIHMEYGRTMHEAFSPATEIQPGDSTTATLTFLSPEGRSALPGVCTLQLEFLLGDDFVLNNAYHISDPNLVTKFEAK